MAGLALERLAEDAVNISARRQQFIPLTIAHLGSTGTAADGFDQIFLEAAAHTETADAVGESLDSDLAAAGFVPGQIAAATLGPTAQDYAALTGSGSSVFDGATTNSGNPAAAMGAAPRLTTMGKTQAILADVAGGVSLDPKEPFGPAQKKNVLDQLRAAREDIESR